MTETHCWTVQSDAYDDYNVDLYDSLETAVARIKSRYGETYSSQWTLQEYPDHHYKLTGNSIGAWSIERRAIQAADRLDELEQK